MGGITNYDSFFREFDIHLKVPLAEMVSDLRSIIVKESCTVLSLLAENFKSNFDSYAVYYLPSLLKQTSVKIKVISDSADQCIQALIKDTQFKNIKTIVEGLKNGKDITIRKKSTSYIKLILEVYDINSLDKLRDIIEPLIIQSLSDASGEVRAEARACYWLYINHYPEQILSLNDKLPSAVLKIIEKEKNNNNSSVNRNNNSLGKSSIGVVGKRNSNDNNSLKNSDEIYVMPSDISALKMASRNSIKSDGWTKSSKILLFSN